MLLATFFNYVLLYYFMFSHFQKEKQCIRLMWHSDLDINLHRFQCYLKQSNQWVAVNSWKRRKSHIDCDAEVFPKDSAWGTSWSETDHQTLSFRAIAVLCQERCPSSDPSPFSALHSECRSIFVNRSHSDHCGSIRCPIGIPIIFCQHSPPWWSTALNLLIIPFGIPHNLFQENGIVISSGDWNHSAASKAATKENEQWITASIREGDTKEIT